MRQRNHYYQNQDNIQPYANTFGPVVPARGLQGDCGNMYSRSAQSEIVEPDELPFIKKQNRELLRVQASRLTDLFPDELVIQEKTISIVHREPMVSYAETIPVRDIGRVVYIDTPIFAGLQILGKNIAHNLKIRGLKKQEAVKAKQILEGLLLVDQGTVDIPDWLEVDQRRDALRDAGTNPEYQVDIKRRGD